MSRGRSLIVSTLVEREKRTAPFERRSSGSISSIKTGRPRPVEAFRRFGIIRSAFGAVLRAWPELKDNWLELARPPSTPVVIRTLPTTRLKSPSLVLAEPDPPSVLDMPYENEYLDWITRCAWIDNSLRAGGLRDDDRRAEPWFDPERQRLVSQH